MGSPLCWHHRQYCHTFVLTIELDLVLTFAMLQPLSTCPLLDLLPSANHIYVEGWKDPFSSWNEFTRPSPHSTGLNIICNEPPFHWTEYNMQCAMCMLATYFDRQVTVALIAVLHSPLSRQQADRCTGFHRHLLHHQQTSLAYFCKSDWQSMAMH